MDSHEKRGGSGIRINAKVDPLTMRVTRRFEHWDAQRPFSGCDFGHLPQVGFKRFIITTDKRPWRLLFVQVVSDPRGDPLGLYNVFRNAIRSARSCAVSPIANRVS
jgi:hypothetical protein